MDGLIAIEDSGAKKRARPATNDVDVSAASLAEMLGITEERLRQLNKEGMPRSGRGKFPLRTCVQWYVAFWRDRALSRTGNDGKQRKLQAEADILETRLAERRGSLIAREHIVAVMQNAYRRLGKSLDTLPTQVGKEFGLAPEVITSLRGRVDDFRRTFVRDNAADMDVRVSVADEPTGPDA